MTTAADRPIVEFIDHARSKGMDHATIRMLLLSAGWKEKDIARAMTEHGLEMAIPAPPDVGGAREAFLHLVAFAALYTAVIAGVNLVFSLINLTWPDVAVTRTPRSGSSSSGPPSDGPSRLWSCRARSSSGCRRCCSARCAARPTASAAPSGAG